MLRISPSRLWAVVAGLRSWQADAVALAGGGLGALALPPYHVLPALVLAVSCLLGLIESGGSVLSAARRGWWFGFGLNIVGLYWITEAILVEAARFWWLVPIAVPALSAVLAMFIAASSAIARMARRGWPRVVVLAGGWVVFDLTRQFIATGFPWNPLGSVWEMPGRAGDIFIQPAAWIGVHGLTLATVLLAALPSLGRTGCIAAIVLLAAWGGFGINRLSWPTPDSLPIRLLLVQGNVAQTAKWDQARRNAIFEHYLELTNNAVRALPGGTRSVVIWPETASPFLIDGDVAARSAIQAASQGEPSLIGAVRFGRDGRPRNSLFALTGAGNVAAMYDKWHLVPFGEYQPDWLSIGIQVVPGGGFAPGPGPKTLNVAGLPPFGALICYEAIFSGEVEAASERPAWLVNITNDAWFGNSSGPRQHLAAARMRAVELGLPLVRAANTGISAVFDGRGHEIGRLGLGITGVLSEALPAPMAPTLYARLGLKIPAFLSALCIVVGLAARRSRFRDI